MGEISQAALSIIKDGATSQVCGDDLYVALTVCKHRGIGALSFIPGGASVTPRPPKCSVSIKAYYDELVDLMKVHPGMSISYENVAHLASYLVKRPNMHEYGGICVFPSGTMLVTDGRRMMVSRFASAQDIQDSAFVLPVENMLDYIQKVGYVNVHFGGTGIFYVPGDGWDILGDTYQGLYLPGLSGMIEEIHATRKCEGAIHLPKDALENAHEIHKARSGKRRKTIGILTRRDGVWRNEWKNRLWEDPGQDMAMALDYMYDASRLGVSALTPTYPRGPYISDVDLKDMVHFIMPSKMDTEYPMYGGAVY